MGYTDATDTRYDRHRRDWRLTYRMLTGDGARKELVRSVFEAELAFENRQKMADWRRYTEDLISRLTGELMSKSDEVQRDAVVSEDYLDSVGPEGESYGVQLVELAETVVAYHEAWVVMDPRQGMHVVEPFRITRSTLGTADPAVIMKGTRDVGQAIDEDQEAQDAWTVYYPDGYEVWVEVEDDNKEADERMVDDGVYYDREEDWTFTQNGRPHPPVVSVTLPWKVRFGLAVAKAHRALYRLESKFDQALTNSLGGLLQIATGGDEEIKKAVKQALKRGDIAVEYHKDAGEHKPLTVGVDGLPHGEKALERKRKELYDTAYQSLQQASTQMSATEAGHRHRAGPAAALSEFAETMKSAEESILPILAQAEDARQAGSDPQANVSWTTDYGSDSDIDSLIEAIFGRPGLPVPDETATDAVMQRLADDGIDAERDAVLEEVRNQRSRAAQSPTDEPLVG